MSKNETKKNMTKEERDAYANACNPNNPNYKGKKKKQSTQQTKSKSSKKQDLKTTPAKPKSSAKLSKNRINEEMHKLEKILGYKFKKISLLAEAMNSTLIENNANSEEYVNERLAIVGDAILDTVIADMLYQDANNKTKKIITNKRIELVNNSVLHRLTNDKGIIEYAYNEYHFYYENPKDNKVVNKEHDAYIEAIIAAIYYDASYKAVKVWIKDHILKDMQRIGPEVKKKKK